MRKQQIIDLRISSMSTQGNGCGTHERENLLPMPIEVPFTLTGDLVRVQLVRKRGGIYFGKLLEMLERSPQHIPPRCVHFSSCGGCRFQHLSYTEQLKLRETFVHDCLRDSLSSGVRIYPITPCADLWKYRAKMEFTFSRHPDGHQTLGLVEEGTKARVFNITECHIADLWFMQAVETVNAWWKETGLDAYRIRHDTGALRTLTLRQGKRTGDRMVILTVSGNPEYSLSEEHLHSLVVCLRNAVTPESADSFFSIYLCVQQIGKGMTTHTYDRLLYGQDHIREELHVKIHHEESPAILTFDIGPSAFFQPNPLQAEQLFAAALNMAEITSDSVVYDLYCGTGTIGLCISKYVKQVIGIEISTESAMCARTNAKKNNCKNVTIFSGAVRNLLNYISTKGIPAPDAVIIDPPRHGIDPEAMRHLLALQPPKILYIACNPVTQAANIKELVLNGYILKAIQPFDYFPQTGQVKNIALLTRAC